MGAGATAGTARLQTNKQLDMRFVTTGSTLYWTVRNVSRRSHGPYEKCVGDDSTFSISAPGDANFFYAGHAYEVLYVSSNGYICFEDEALQFPQSDGGIDGHFFTTKGPCFSFLFADLNPESIHVCHTDIEELGGTPEARWVPYSTVLTFLEVPLKGADATALKNSVQLQVVYHTNSFVATYGCITPAISAVLGPSLGLGSVPGFTPRMV